MPSEFRVASNTFYQLLAKMISALSTVVATALITRGLGVSAFGTFFLMTGFATYFYLLLDFGINTVAIREIAADKLLTSRYFNGVLSLRLVFSAILVIILSILLPFVPFRLEDINFLRWGIFIGLLSLISQAIYNSCTMVLQSSLNYQKTIISAAIGNLSFLIMAILIIFYWPNTLLLVVANTLGTFLVAASIFFLVRRMLRGATLSLDFKLWRRVLVLSLPLGLTIFLTVVVAKADAFLLSVMTLPSEPHMTNAEALGYYGLAYKIFENILVFPTYFVNALFPMMIIHKKESPNKLTKTLRRSLVTMFSVSVVVMIVGYWLSPLAIMVLSGQGEGSPAVAALRLLLLGLPFFFCSAVLMFFLITSGKEWRLPWIYLTAAIFNVILNIRFIPSFGFMASALLTGVTEVVILVLLAVATVKSLRTMKAHDAGI